MRKKVLSAVLAATMVAGMMGNVVSVSAEKKVGCRKEKGRPSEEKKGVC